MNRTSLINQIEALQKTRQKIRSQERGLRGRSEFLDMEPVVSNEGDLRSNLAKILPTHLVPTNVGDLYQILQPFDYSVEFDDIGANPTFSGNTYYKKSFQVTQEAGFLLTGINRNYNDGGVSGMKAPLSVTIRDNQSTRQFMDKAIPIQMLGDRGRETFFPTPYLFIPNASVTVELTSWINNTWATTGDGYQQLVFSGYRIPIEDAKFVANSVYL